MDIERVIAIDAPREKVWTVMTDTAHASAKWRAWAWMPADRWSPTWHRFVRQVCEAGINAGFPALSGILSPACRCGQELFDLR